MDAEIIEIPIYKTKVELYAYDNIETSISLLKHKYNKYNFNIDQNTVGYSTWIKVDGINKFIILINRDSDYSIIAHESLHLTWYILDSIGLEVNSKNHEAQAYLLEYLLNNIFKHLQNEQKN